MLKVGYPASLAPELLQLFPAGIELLPLASNIQGETAIDFWIPSPMPAQAREIWRHLRGVKIAQGMMAGTDWLTELVGPSVTVCNAQGAHNISTAEWTLTAILASLNYLPLYRDMQNAADWRGSWIKGSEAYAAIHKDNRPQFPTVMHEELTGKRVLMVGYGDIGKTIERMLAPFDVEMTRVARTARSEPKVHPVELLDELLPHAEIVVLIVPLTSATHGLIGATQLALMQQGTLLVNAARGPVVQTDALVEALNSGRIRAALDVTDPEPLPPEHPLWRCPNLLLTPHIGGATPQFSPRATRIAAEQVARLLKGEPLKFVVQQGKA